MSAITQQRKTSTDLIIATGDHPYAEPPRALRSTKTWPDCPQCKQSATGKYLGRHGCTRCGWTGVGA